MGRRFDDELTERLAGAATRLAAAIVKGVIDDTARALAADVLLAAAADGQVSAATLRKRRQRERDKLRDIGRDRSVTERDQSVTSHAGSHAPSRAPDQDQDQDPPLSGQIPEEEEENRGEGQDRAPVTLGVTERDTAPTRARLLTIWQRVALRGMPAGSASLHGGRLFTLWPALCARASKQDQDPFELFERVVAAYVADRKAKGRAPDTRFFVDDFDGFAEREHVTAPKPRPTMSEPVPALDERARRVRDLQAQLRNAEALLESANDAGRPRAQLRVERLRADLAELGTVAA